MGVEFLDVALVEKVVEDFDEVLHDRDRVDETLRALDATSERHKATELASGLVRQVRGVRSLGWLLSLDDATRERAFGAVLPDDSARERVANWLELLHRGPAWRALAHALPHSFPEPARDVIELIGAGVTEDELQSMIAILDDEDVFVRSGWTTDPPSTGARHVWAVLARVGAPLPWDQVGLLLDHQASRGRWMRDGAAVVFVDDVVGAQFPPLPAPFAHRAPRHISSVVESALALRSLLARDGTAHEGQCPYPGLVVFHTDDAGWFFGRDPMLLSVRTRWHERAPRPRWVSIEGASGSGKSSFLHAALLPALRWGLFEGTFTSPRVVVLDARLPPLDALRAADDGLRGAEMPVLVIDALDALAAAHDQEILTKFTAALRILLDASPALTLITTLRSDMAEWVLTRLADLRVVAAGRSSSWWHDALHVAVEAPSHDEMMTIIEAPARRAGRRFERALASKLEADARNAAASLALTQGALNALWLEDITRVPGLRNTLTNATYIETGGVTDALVRRIEHRLGTLSPPECEHARELLTSLVRVGRGTPDTRRSMPLTDWRGDPEDAVAATLVDLHVVVIHEGHVDLAHDALVLLWPRLQQWIVESRLGLERREEVEHLAALWVRHGRQNDGLVGGATARGLLEVATRRDLTADARTYLHALDEQERRAARAAQRAIVLRWVTPVAALCVVAMVGWGARWGGNRAELARIASIRAEGALRSAREARELSIAAREEARRSQANFEAERRRHVEAEAAARGANATARSQREARERIEAERDAQVRRGAAAARAWAERLRVAREEEQRATSEAARLMGIAQSQESLMERQREMLATLRIRETTARSEAERWQTATTQARSLATSLQQDLEHERASRQALVDISSRERAEFVRALQRAQDDLMDCRNEVTVARGNVQRCEAQVTTKEAELQVCRAGGGPPQPPAPAGP